MGRRVGMVGDWNRIYARVEIGTMYYDIVVQQEIDGRSMARRTTKSSSPSPPPSFLSFSLLLDEIRALREAESRVRKERGRERGREMEKSGEADTECIEPCHAMVRQNHYNTR
jgi:hypothetical protein